MGLNSSWAKTQVSPILKTEPFYPKMLAQFYHCCKRFFYAVLLFYHLSW